MDSVTRREITRIEQELHDAVIRAEAEVLRRLDGVTGRVWHRSMAQ